MTMTNNSISLYIHFPFCLKKCNYCAFYSTPEYDGELLDAYTEAVIRRIRSMPAFTVKTVYFGGGTPTLLGEKRLIGVLESIFNTQRVADNAEITLEANPATVERSQFEALRNSGFTRLSLGMQSANDETLRFMGRAHDNKTFLCCYDNARRYFDNISLDMIFGVPYDDISPTLRQLKALSPEHISAYSLSVEENTPFYMNKSNISFPSEDEEEKQYYDICRCFSNYSHYEVSSFAMKGFESKHNSAYWKRDDYIGIGPAAHSFYCGKRFSTKSDVIAFIRNSALPFLSDTDFYSTEAVSDAEAEEERIMLGLRMAEGVKLDSKQLLKAQRYVSAGLGSVNGDVFSLNEKGYRLSNSIIADLI